MNKEAFLSPDQVQLLKRTMLSKFAEDEQETFILVCQRTRLDPFTRQIYATKRYQKVDGQKVPVLVIVAGIMGLTAIADRTGNYDGCVIHWAGPDALWREEWLAAEPPAAARCVVHHKLHRYPEVGIARWDGYAGQTYNYQTKSWELSDFWSKYPDMMLGKCAKAQALRAGFPDQCSGIYITEELDSELTEAVPSDEAKYAAARQREARDRAEHPDQYVTSGPAPHSPAQATEEAFEEDKIPAPPPVPPKAAVTETEAPDDLEMAPAQEPPWKTHVILGLRHVKYYKKALGDIRLLPSPDHPEEGDLTTLEEQWIPAVRKKWTEASPEQKKDVEMLEAALAYHKMQKPW